MERGIENLNQCIGYVLAFSPNLQSVEINDKRKASPSKNVYKATNVEFKTAHKVEFITTKCLEVEDVRNKSTTKYLVASYKQGAVQMCIKLDKDWKVLTRGIDEPTLYADYPLVGSNNFRLPCVINSHIFLPNEERSSIVLQNVKHSHLNKFLIIKSVLLYSFLLKIAEEKKFENSGILCQVYSNMEGSGIVCNKVWFDKHYMEPMVKEACRAPLLRAHDCKELIPPCKLIMP